MINYNKEKQISRRQRGGGNNPYIDLEARVSCGTFNLHYL